LAFFLSTIPLSGFLLSFFIGTEAAGLTGAAAGAGFPAGFGAIGGGLFAALVRAATAL